MENYGSYNDMGSPSTVISYAPSQPLSYNSSIQNHMRFLQPRNDRRFSSLPNYSQSAEIRTSQSSGRRNSADESHSQRCNSRFTQPNDMRHSQINDAIYSQLRDARYSMQSQPSFPPNSPFGASYSGDFNLAYPYNNHPYYQGRYPESSVPSSLQQNELSHAQATSYKEPSRTVASTSRMPSSINRTVSSSFTNNNQSNIPNRSILKNDYSLKNVHSQRSYSNVGYPEAPPSSSYHPMVKNHFNQPPLNPYISNQNTTANPMNLTSSSGSHQSMNSNHEGHSYSLLEAFDSTITNALTQQSQPTRKAEVPTSSNSGSQNFSILNVYSLTNQQPEYDVNKSQSANKRHLRSLSYDSHPQGDSQLNGLMGELSTLSSKQASNNQGFHWEADKVAQINQTLATRIEQETFAPFVPIKQEPIFGDEPIIAPECNQPIESNVPNFIPKIEAQEPTQKQNARKSMKNGLQEMVREDPNNSGLPIHNLNSFVNNIPAELPADLPPLPRHQGSRKFPRKSSQEMAGDLPNNQPHDIQNTLASNEPSRQQSARKSFSSTRPSNISKSYHDLQNSSSLMAQPSMTDAPEVNNSEKDPATAFNYISIKQEPVGEETFENATPEVHAPEERLVNAHIDSNIRSVYQTTEEICNEALPQDSSSHFTREIQNESVGLRTRFFNQSPDTILKSTINSILDKQSPKARKKYSNRKKKIKAGHTLKKMEFSCPNFYCLFTTNDILKFSSHLDTHEALLSSTQNTDLPGNQAANSNEPIKVSNWQCILCNKFSTRSDKILTYHVNKEIGYRPYCCQVCGETFVASDFFIRHCRQSHSQQKPDYKLIIDIKLKNAGETVLNFIKTSQYLDKDEKAPTSSMDDYKFYCPDCGIKLRDPVELQRHIYRDKKYYPYQCLHCNKSFIEYETSHFRNKHPGLPVQFYKTTIDEIETLTIQIVEEQKMIRDAKKENLNILKNDSFKCCFSMDCRFETNHPEMVKIHIICHLTSQKYKCAYCFVTTNSPDSLNHHYMKYHKGLPVQLLKIKDILREQSGITLNDFNETAEKYQISNLVEEALNKKPESKMRDISSQGPEVGLSLPASSAVFNSTSQNQAIVESSSALRSLPHSLPQENVEQTSNSSSNVIVKREIVYPNENLNVSNTNLAITENAFQDNDNDVGPAIDCNANFNISNLSYRDDTSSNSFQDQSISKRPVGNSKKRKVSKKKTSAKKKKVTPKVAAVPQIQPNAYDNCPNPSMAGKKATPLAIPSKDLTNNLSLSTLEKISEGYFKPQKKECPQIRSLLVERQNQIALETAPSLEDTDELINHKDAAMDSSAVTEPSSLAHADNSSNLNLPSVPPPLNTPCLSSSANSVPLQIKQENPPTELLAKTQIEASKPVSMTARKSLLPNSSNLKNNESLPRMKITARKSLLPKRPSSIVSDPFSTVGGSKGQTARKSFQRFLSGPKRTARKSLASSTFMEQQSLLNLQTMFPSGFSYYRKTHPLDTSKVFYTLPFKICENIIPVAVKLDELPFNIQPRLKLWSILSPHFVEDDA